MSLYYDTAPYLSAQPGSLKSRVFSNTTSKSPAKQIFALASEASQWSAILSEVIEHAGLLKLERKLSPNIALLLVHDLLLTRRGISAPAAHPLRLAVEKHKARLTAELTRARLKRRISTLEELKAEVKAGGGRDERPTVASNGTLPSTTPDSATQTRLSLRWVRINSLKTTVEVQLQSTFAGYTVVDTLAEVAGSSSDTPAKVFIDKHIPNLLAVPRHCELLKTPAYRNGLLILQDKASCFPAYMLDPDVVQGQCIDACAAPGNKTTHLAAILHDNSTDTSVNSGVIHAFERDKARAVVLENMLAKAGAAGCVSIHKKDFLRSDPAGEAWSGVSALLLDPSCSGSGIIGRDDTIHVTLPRINLPDAPLTGSKRKRKKPQAIEEPKPDASEMEEAMLTTESSPEKLATRLAALSAFQLKILLHAFQFPRARRIVYSTCSVHAEENEHVVMHALSDSHQTGSGWRILLRDEQVSGLQAWTVRGDLDACNKWLESTEHHQSDVMLGQDIAEACVRCEKDTAEGTQGFFVAGFVRDEPNDGFVDELEWEGFDE